MLKVGYSYLLVARLALVNLIGLSLLAVLHAHGVIDKVIAADHLHVVTVIAAVFVVGLFLVFKEGWRICNQFRIIASLNGRYIPIDIDGATDRLKSKLATMGDFSTALVMLGLIGTAAGLQEAMSALGLNASADAGSAQTAVRTLVSGMGVALYATLAGSIGNVWLRMNIRMVATAATQLVNAYRKVRL